jgi:FxsC-like protein
MSRIRTVTAPRPTYFFLSYAHSAPISPEAGADVDAWVSKFFDDLSGEVGERARPGSGLEIGFFDRQVPLGSDWKAVIAERLGAAEVFVPLYSPGYFIKSWPMRERESFLDRLPASAADGPDEHVVPVLWTPLPPWEDRLEIRAALVLGEGVPEYAENGLRALCMLRAYRDQYTLVLGRLAERIVHLAERSPLGPSEAPGLDQVVAEAVDEAAAGETPFVVAVSSPNRLDLPPWRSAASYGQDGTKWRPFAGGQALPAAEYAANTAERLGFHARVTDIRYGTGLFARSPAVLLIDPWVAAGDGGLQGLLAATMDLPAWVIPLVVADPQDPQYAEREAMLTGQVLAMLVAAGVQRAQQATGMKEFVEIMPRLITDARRQYLRKGPVFPPAGPAGRPAAERPSLRGRTGTREGNADD